MYCPGSSARYVAMIVFLLTVFVICGIIATVDLGMPNPNNKLLIAMVVLALVAMFILLTQVDYRSALRTEAQTRHGNVRANRFAAYTDDDDDDETVPLLAVECEPVAPVALTAETEAINQQIAEIDAVIRARFAEIDATIRAHFAEYI